jgi:hypothetical protein
MREEENFKVIKVHSELKRHTLQTEIAAASEVITVV